MDVKTCDASGAAMSPRDVEADGQTGRAEVGNGIGVGQGRGQHLTNPYPP